ncbi:UNVERIFIED_CONTAM: hypothetical protein Sradi_4506500 [Sesamum radiatum]|uniref:Reverse transcriptase zinc-binding domain-containing protein n=1 Tax=Sesamum radiatum TaxID=300843 RepID=A0AAW2NAH4_SESRA
MNKALMMKHLWKIVRQDRKSIWVAWIDSLWTFNRSTGSWSWKKLIKLRPVLKSGLMYQVGSGNLFKLWHDIWHEQGPLCFSYPRGPMITGLPLGSLLSSVLQNGQWHWPTQNDTEILRIMAHLPQVHQNTPDAITWRNSSGEFSVQSAIQLFQSRTNRVAWHGLLHSMYKIPRHVFILWLAIWEKLSTMDKIWISRGDNGCVLCDGQHVETHDHLFFNCHFSRRCLQIVQRQVRLHWPHSDWQRGILWASKRWRLAHLLNEASRALLAALVYHLWTERNNRKFRATGSAAETAAKQVIEVIRLRIMSEEFSPSLQHRSLYRIWKIAWPLGH